MLWNVLLFLVKLAFCIKFIASFLLIKLKIPEVVMSKIILEILLKSSSTLLINHDIHCRHLVETWIYNLRNTNSDKYHTLFMHLFY